MRKRELGRPMNLAFHDGFVFLPEYFNVRNPRVKIAAIALSEPPEVVPPFIEPMGAEHANWVDGPGEESAADRSRDLFSRFGGLGLPTTAFVARNGTLQAAQVAEPNRAILRTRSEELSRLTAE